MIVSFLNFFMKSYGKDKEALFNVMFEKDHISSVVGVGIHY